MLLEDHQFGERCSMVCPNLVGVSAQRDVSQGMVPTGPFQTAGVHNKRLTEPCLMQPTPRLSGGGPQSRVPPLLDIEGQSLVGTPVEQGGDYHPRGPHEWQGCLCLKISANTTDFGTIECIDTENV